MLCSECGKKKSKVTYTYSKKKTNRTKRNRVCVECGHKFVTVESVRK